MKGEYKFYCKRLTDIAAHLATEVNLQYHWHIVFDMKYAMSFPKGRYDWCNWVSNHPFSRGELLELMAKERRDGVDR